MTDDLQMRAINSIRFLAADVVQQANSGHPGLPMGAAPMAFTLWTRHLRHNPRNPKWPGRDRFILSGGHGSMLLYSLLHLTGYDLSLDEIKNFRQFDSKTPGVEVTAIRIAAISQAPTTTFETLPFPWAPGKEPKDDPRVQAIAQAAKELVEQSDRWLNAEGLSEAEKKK